MFNEPLLKIALYLRNNQLHTYLSQTKNHCRSRGKFGMISENNGMFCNLNSDVTEMTIAHKIKQVYQNKWFRWYFPTVLLLFLCVDIGYCLTNIFYVGNRIRK